MGLARRGWKRSRGDTRGRQGRTADDARSPLAQNIHSYKYSGLVNNKSLFISPKDGGLSIKTRKADADSTFAPPPLHNLPCSFSHLEQDVTSPRPRVPPRASSPPLPARQPVPRPSSPEATGTTSRTTPPSAPPGSRPSRATSQRPHRRADAAYSCRSRACEMQL